MRTDTPRNGVLQACKNNVTFASLDQHKFWLLAEHVSNARDDHDSVVFVLGDSHAMQWGYRYNYLAVHHGDSMPTVRSLVRWGELPIFNR